MAGGIRGIELDLEGACIEIGFHGQIIWAKEHTF
jgi:hypothetical protein